MLPKVLWPRPRELLTVTHRVSFEVPEPSASVEVAHRRAHLMELLANPVPLLENKQPAEAAADPRLRPLVVHWTKGQINDWDRFALKHGITDDLDWIARDLHMPELDLPAPPARKPFGEPSP